MSKSSQNVTYTLMIAYTDFIEGLQKYFESCNTANTTRKFSCLHEERQKCRI